MEGSLLFAREIPVTEDISVKVPTIGEIFEDLDAYYADVSCFTNTPYDMMVQLDDIGIDFTKITAYQLFAILLPGLQKENTGLLFSNLKVEFLKPVADKETGQICFMLGDKVVIDEGIYTKIGDTLRRINGFVKQDKKPGNEAARKYLIERERKKQKRHARQKKEYPIENLIIAMVNTEQFKYDFESVKTLTLYQFNACTEQVIRKTNYEHLMTGCYAGTVDMKKIDMSEMDWLKLKS